MNNTNIKCMASLCIRMNPKRHTQASFTIERTCRLKDSYTCSEYASYKERTNTYINKDNKQFDNHRTIINTSTDSNTTMIGNDSHGV